jgi:type IV secretory pathway VirB2 component (pilin)
MKIDKFRIEDFLKFGARGSAFVLLVGLPRLALASVGAGGGLPYEGWLAALRNSVTGPVAFTVALFGIIGAGATLIFQGGEMNSFLRTIIYVVLVMAFLVSAQNILGTLFGHGAELAFLGPMVHFAREGLVGACQRSA